MGVCDRQSYVENLLVMKGAPGWQYLFAEVDLCDREFQAMVSQLDRALEALPVLRSRHHRDRNRRSPPPPIFALRRGLPARRPRARGDSPDG
ncbi:hypothetical protein AB0I53_16995 [Saccharopolyspora sp. NPDC050389]|uniref:hypothetical protein n=1 Tax=Saccharopolyspora sp. NPDC050389 TaxID=3155516 RepID=UPI0033C91EB8